MAEILLQTALAKAPDMQFTVLFEDDQHIRAQKYQWNIENQRLKSVGSIQTILDMNALINDAIEIIKPSYFFSPDFPEFLLPVDHPNYQQAKLAPEVAITWGVVRKMPGTAGGAPFSGTKEVKPRVREALAIFSDESAKFIPNPSETDITDLNRLVRYLRIKAQCFDNLVQYNIWAKSNYEVEIATEWFELFIELYRGMIREAGINDIYFNRRVRDDTVVQMRNGYHVRSVLYYVRTERVLVDTILPINKINISVNVNDLNNIKERIGQNITDKSFYREIINKWINNE